MIRVRRLTLLVSVAAATQVHAQPAALPSASAFTVAAGAALPMSSLDEFYDLGYIFEAGVEFTPRLLPFGIRGELGYTRFRAHTVTAVDPSGVEESFEPKSSHVSITLNAMLDPGIRMAQIRPYAVVGVGAYNTSEGGRFSGGVVEFEGSDRHASLGFNAGAGLRFQRAGVSLFLEARYHHIAKGLIDHKSQSQNVEWRSASYVPITLGISLGRR